MLRPGGDSSQLDRRVRLVLGEPLILGKSLKGLAAAELPSQGDCYCWHLDGSSCIMMILLDGSRKDRPRR
jgi:hypothetical protein